ncbi:MAG: 50S ribosomal protein L29 [Candidatus Sericytochromatia bacterium]|uniref:Large ribosomal subunit protein uL29 n=1 Tax=Candidatus Tanganyikabacteria bacterium TaxID=2961651 RepID=A0A937X5D7_9BACT|nr:50S ribosomal protein L29 [Candidatus Tanganyikabacteria bacterium]
MPKTTTTYGDLLGKTPDELRAELKAAKEELFQLRFQLAIKQLENTAKIGEVRHRVAQLTAALNESLLKAKGA